LRMRARVESSPRRRPEVEAPVACAERLSIVRELADRDAVRGEVESRPRTRRCERCAYNGW
jgi:hypothetical protein